MIEPYVPPDNRNWQIGERCTVKLKFRAKEIIGGWKTFHYAAVITKVNKMTVRVSRVGWWDDLLVRKDQIF